jgi:3-hydroxyacyl-[acyl-carrier-protein] dehydratase
MMDIQEILQYLPHRYPFLLIDKVKEFVPEKSLVGIKNVTINEPFFMGHFPAQAVMPGVLIVEALAQAAGILAYKCTGTDNDALFYLGTIEKARFKKRVVPGDQLHLQVLITQRRGHVWKFSGVATVDGEVVCTAEMTCAQGAGKVQS